MGFGLASSGGGETDATPNPTLPSPEGRDGAEIEDGVEPVIDAAWRKSPRSFRPTDYWFRLLFRVVLRGAGDSLYS